MEKGCSFEDKKTEITNIDLVTEAAISKLDRT